MHRIVTLLVFCLAAGLPGAEVARAQNWRPFGEGRTYHYREAGGAAGVADTLYTFRVDSAYVQGGDSVWCFNRTGGSPHGIARGMRINLFGGWMQWNPMTGEARMGAEGTAVSATLLTRAAVGQTWAFTPTVQATMTGRQATTTLGLADTVATISLSDGQTVQLSRRLGVVSGPGFDYYLGRTHLRGLRRRALTLAAVPEVAPSELDTRWEGIWSWQVGDELYYRTRSSFEDYNIMNPQPPSSTLGMQQLIVRGRRVSANEDTIMFDLEEVANLAWYGNSFWGGAPAFTMYTSGQIIRQRVVRDQVPTLLTGVPGLIPSHHHFAYAEPAWQRADTFLNRPVTELHVMVPDWGSDVAYAPGLGAVLERWEGGVNSWSMQESLLVGYVSGALRWGNTSVPQPLGVGDAAVALPAGLLPNPSAAGQEAALVLTLERP
ncbi:MAG TPA: hypothetical protein VEI97_05930, partial [bacterium]|nr:hypothetical protein [bacterium]